MVKTFLKTATACGVFGMFAASAHAQIVVGTGARLETINYSDAAVSGVKSVALFSVPFGATARLNEWASLSAGGAFASGRATNADDSESEISGLTDTSIGVTLGTDRFAVQAAYILPTGKSGYTEEETAVAGIFASDLFPFSITNWGGGGGFDVSSSVAVPLGAVNLGARLGYAQAQEFDLFEGQASAYRPGSSLYGRVALDGSVGSGRLAAEVTFYQFAEDQFESENLFQSGDRIQAIVSYSFAMGRQGSGALYGGLLNREHGAFLNGLGETASQKLFLAGAGLRRPMGGAVFAPSLDLRVLSKSDGVAQGYIAGAGATIELPLGSAATLLPSARVRIGNLKQDDSNETGITGFEVGAGLRFGRARP